MQQSVIREKDALINLVNTYNKIMLVHGPSFEKMSVRDMFRKINCVEFTDFTPNPTYDSVCEGVKLFNQEQCDAIIAIGGGSAIDVAKCIKLFCKMDARELFLRQEKEDTKIPLIAVPTTAGTGSEATKHAVIYYKGEKQSVSHESIIPNYAVLLPELLKLLPVYQKKCTMFDALCQAIESWWSMNSIDESIEYSKKAIDRIVKNWKLYINGENKDVAAEILEAAYYAGKAINITATTAAHAMSYKITSLYKLPHGHAVALCISQVWSYMLEHIADCNDSRGAKYLSEVFREIESHVSKKQFDEMLEELQMEKPVSEDKEKDLDILVKSVNPERLGNNPIRLSEAALRNMYERIIK